MEFKPQDAYLEHRATAKAWVARNLDPKWVEEQESSGTHHTPELHRRLAADGFLGASWPAEYGGSGADPALATTVFQEIAAAGGHTSAWNTTSMVLNTVLHVGTEQQKKDWLSAAARGEMTVVLGYTEPGSGSDVAAAKTRAVRDGDDWVINGSKMFTSTAHVSTHVFMLCRTNLDAPKHRGLTTFIVPLDAPGVEIQPMYTLGGQRTNATFYSDVRIPDTYRVGDVDGGWGVMRVALVYERVVGAPPSGPTWADRGAAWARSVRQADCGTPLLEDPVVRDRLAHIAIESEVARLMTDRVTWMAQTGGMPAVEGALAKLYTNEGLQRNLSSLLDLIGEEAVLQDGAGGEGGDFPRAVEAAHRKAVVGTIYGGTSEIMREIIAERKLGLPRSRPGGK